NMLNVLFAQKMPVLTIEEAVLEGGFGSAVLEYAHEAGHHGAVIDRMGIPDQFIEHGSVGKLLEEIDLTKEEAVRRVAAFVREKQEERA
ncbi:transketolase C-terminal domain-containing protein, partial [Bacillus licheniformis]|uniref:transketolase C-terminal domain-containing protein n=2 Tax=Bacillaceae TaxID=186817 RepID=UPI0033155C06